MDKTTATFPTPKFTILVDMDGVIADFNARLVANYVRDHPDQPYVRQDEATEWDICLDYKRLIGQQAYLDIQNIYKREKGFYFSLDPIPGAFAALNEMVADGHTVFICTAPTSTFETCVDEKYQWVLKHMGRAWTDRMVLTRDKTLVRGDFLIDDKPKVRGSMSPVWKQILYQQPYNTSTDLPRITDWSRWREQITPTTSVL